VRPWLNQAVYGVGSNQRDGVAQTLW
jgi:hypothetical protein